MATTQIPISASGQENLKKTDVGYDWGDQFVARCFNDEAMAYMYSRFKREQLLDILFYEKSYTLLEFLNYYLHKDTSTLACFQKKKQGDELEICGMGWLNDVTELGPNHARATCGMAFFRGFAEPDYLVRFAQMMIEWAFDHLPIDALHGFTPAKNVPAVRFSKKIGFQVLGPLEGYTVWQGELADVYISSMTKSRWDSVSPWRKEG